jgi:hypothetical protein
MKRLSQEGIMLRKTRWLVTVSLALVLASGLLVACSSHSSDEQASKDAIKEKIKRDQ